MAAERGENSQGQQLEIECARLRAEINSQKDAVARAARVWHVHGMDGVCTACVIYVRGEASPISPREAQLLANVESLAPEWKPRIACLARVSGSVEVRTTYW